MIGELFFRIGQTLGGLESQLGMGRARAEAGEGAGEGADEAEDLPDDGAVAAGAVVSAAGAWLASRLLRPKPVRWPRVVVAGVTGALLADLVGRLEEGGGEPSGDPPHANDPTELLGRIAAGIGVAAGYASIVYPRIPGSPLMRGLAFGALEIAAAPRGGLVRLAADAPGLRFPLQALALPVDEDASPLAHMAFGLALGLLYRNGRSAEEEEGEDALD